MSYSFGVRATSKADAKQQVAAKFDETIAQQPIHAADREQAQAAAHAFIDALHDDEAKDVVASVSGWISSQDGTVLGANVSVSANLVAREAG